ncbi:MACPF domain-containing protein 2 [Plakobranchus ocellatus]|uniref:MACPF domain-containing protein 2 n=1 Tax=Plakobranchus ocellatus TaxID=259542 RepID=A0AAV4CYD6_9GAST|nr:MACPF domain-containing protein 2 [Plakobranchus ocellatus]
MTISLDPPEISKAYAGEVTLRCEPNISQTVEVETLSIIRIMKRDTFDATEKTWVTLTETKNVDIDNAFIQITWPSVVPETFGVYRCDAIGFTTNSDIVLGKSEDLDIGLSALTANSLLDLLLETKNYLQENVVKNSDEISNLDLKLTTLLEKEKDISREIADRFKMSEKTRESVIRSLLFPTSSVHWPGQRYALLQPVSGCPVDFSFYGGHTGYFKLHAVSSSDFNKSSNNSHPHIAGPLYTVSGENQFITLKFCVTNGAFNTGNWPNGNYCILKVGSSYPTGLSAGSIDIRTKSTNNQDNMGGNIPSGKPSQMQFCCKRSSDRSQLMVMPTEHPFYLYRLGGACQEIAGMDVQLEYFEIQTEGSNRASGTFPYHIPQSDGSLRFEICYYSKS